MNKKPLSGIIVLSLYFIDSIFDLTDKLCLAHGWYYSFTVLFFLIISSAIHGQGFKKYVSINEVKKLEEELKEEVPLKDIEDMQSFEEKNDNNTE